VAMKAPLSTAELSHLIGLIYDAAIDPDRWPVALEAIRVALDFATTALGVSVFPTGRPILNVTTNLPPEYKATMVDYGPEILEQWGGWDAFRAFPLDRPQLLSRVNPAVLDFATTRNRYSLEWRQPQGLIDNLNMPLAMDDRGVGLLGMGRHRDAGPVSEIEIETARLLMPHLQRAVAINRLFDFETFARSTFEQTLDRLASPVLLVTADMFLIHANPAAQKLLAAGDLLRLHQGAIMATSNGADAALTVAVAQAAQDESAIGRKGLGVPSWRRDGTAAALHVLPLNPERLSVAASTAVAAIFVAEADAPRAAPAALIASLFDLTTAEARVFEEIAAGRSVAATARTLALKPSTVRTHLLRIFNKTGTRRQVDLVRLAASLAGPAP